MKGRKIMVHDDIINNTGNNTNDNTNNNINNNTNNNINNNQNTNNNSNSNRIDNPFNKPKTEEKIENEESNESFNSFNSMKAKLKTYYRPLIKEYIKKGKNKQNKFQKDFPEHFEKYPHVYNNTICEDNGNTTMRYIIPSINKVIEDSKFMNNTKVPISIYCNPLNFNSNLEEEIQIIDKTDKEILRCDRCKAFVNSNFHFSNNFNAYTCNICYNKGTVDSKYDINEECVEINKGSYEFLVDSSKYQNNKNINCDTIAIIIQSNNDMIQSGAFGRIMSNIEYLLNSFPQNFNLIILTLDNSLQYYKFKDNENIETWFNLDCCSPFSINEISLNIEKDKDKIINLLKFITQTKYDNFENNFEENKNLKINYINTFNSIKDLFNKEGGRALFFLDNSTSIFTNDDLKNIKEDTKKLIFNNVFNQNNKQIKEFFDLGQSIFEDRIICELFYFSSKSNYNLIPFTQIFKRSSGQIYIYNNYNDEVHYERLYYDILNCFNKNIGFDIAFKVRTNDCFDILNYYTPLGIKNDLDFSLNSLNSNQTIVCNFSQNGKPKKDIVCFQFVTLYTNIWNQRLIRIHNIKLPIEKNKLTIYKYVNTEVIIYSFLKEFIYKFGKYTINDNGKNIYKKLKEIMGHYRYDSGNTYDSREFAMPNTLKYFPLYTFNLLCKPIFNSAIGLKLNNIYENLVETENLDLQNLLLNLNPKIFKINLNILKKDYGENDENLNVVKFPPSIPCIKDIIKDENIYIINNGKNILIYVKKNVPEDLLENSFGITEYDKLLNINEFPSIDNELNIRMNRIIEGINANRINYLQNVLIITDESDLEREFISKIYTEGFESKKGKSYWLFLNKLHKNIKLDY